MSIIKVINDVIITRDDIIGASLNEPHTSHANGDFVYIYIYVAIRLFRKRITLLILIK